MSPELRDLENKTPQTIRFTKLMATKAPHQFQAQVHSISDIGTDKLISAGVIAMPYLVNRFAFIHQVHMYQILSPETTKRHFSFIELYQCRSIAHNISFSFPAAPPPE